MLRFKAQLKHKTINNKFVLQEIGHIYTKIIQKEEWNPNQQKSSREGQQLLYNKLRREKQNRKIRILIRRCEDIIL